MIVNFVNALSLDIGIFPNSIWERYCNVSKKKEMQHGLKCYKNLYLHREERKYCPCKQLVCGKLVRKKRPFNSLYFLCPFGWVEENRALFLVLQLLEKSSQACIGIKKTERTGGHVLILRNRTSKRGRRS